MMVLLVLDVLAVMVQYQAVVLTSEPWDGGSRNCSRCLHNLARGRRGEGVRG